MIPRENTLKLFVRNQACKLGAAVSAARKQQGVSQAYLARQLHVTIPTLRKLESGDASVSMGTCIAALLLLKIEGEVLNTTLSSFEPLPQLGKGKEVSFQRQLKRQGISAADAEYAAGILALPPEQRIQALINLEKGLPFHPIEKAAALVQSIEQHHGRAMLIGGAALFLYGKARQSRDYQLWVRIANDELVEIVTAHGFEIDSNRAGRLVAYDGECKFELFLLKRAYNQDKALLEYDAIEARGRVVTLAQGKLMVPGIEDMLKLKKLGEDTEAKDLEDIAYLEALNKVDIEL